MSVILGGGLLMNNRYRNILLFFSFVLLVSVFPVSAARVDAEIDAVLAEKGAARVMIVYKSFSAVDRALANIATNTAVTTQQQTVTRNADAVVLDVTEPPAVETPPVVLPVAVETSLMKSPIVIATVTAEGLAALAADPTVKAVYLSKTVQIELATSGPAIKADAVWNQQVKGIPVTGAGQTVCVIDTGIDPFHEMFAGKIRAQKCYCGAGGPCCQGVLTSDNATDDHGHGTHVAGIAAGKGPAVNGVAKDASIVAVKVCSSGGSCDYADMASAIDYCTSIAPIYNISVITMSIGDGGAYATQADCPTDLDPEISAATAANIAVTVASGNSGSTTGISYPACSPTATSVGATSHDGSTIMSFSERGPLLDVVAPGSVILSALMGGGYTTMSGTSMATPHVAGVAALLAQHAKLIGKSFVPAQFEEYLENTSNSVSSFRQVDALSVLVLQATGITYNSTNRSLTSPFSGVLYHQPLNVSRVQQCMNLTFNNVSMRDTAACASYYNLSGAVRLEKIGVSPTPVPYVNGVPCLFPQCDNVSLSTARMQFDVSHFSSYHGGYNSSTGGPCTVGPSGLTEVFSTYACTILGKTATYQPRQCVSYKKMWFDGMKYVEKMGTFCDDAVTDYSCMPGGSTPVLKRARTCTDTCTPRGGAGLQAVTGTSKCSAMGGWSPDCFSYWTGISWDSKCDDGKTDYTCGTVGKSTVVQLLKQDVICA